MIYKAVRDQAHVAIMAAEDKSRKKHHPVRYNK